MELISLKSIIFTRHCSTYLDIVPCNVFFDLIKPNYFDNRRLEISIKHIPCPPDMLTVSSSTLSDTKYKCSDTERKKRKQVMDEHQKRVIMDNMDWICENTGDEFQLSTWFYLNGFLTKSEYDFMNSRRSRFEKNYSLFNHVINKGSSFQVLLNYLRNTGNQIVANLLENKLKEKLSYKRKMVGSTLEKFLIPYLTFLCTETRNDDTIVKELLGKGFITMDDSTIIRTHPDIFYRNAELYKYLRHKCNYEEMVRILRETGNGKIADHLDSVAV